MSSRLLYLAFALCLPGVAHAEQSAATVDGVAITLAPVAENLRQPIFLTAPKRDPRLFVVEQGGRIRIIENGAVRPEPFLDIADAIRSGGEQGLLGLAFHPAYATNGRFFVNYTDRQGDTQIVAYRVSPDASVADKSSAATILSVDQPAPNHNGGWLGFGPDGFLYVGMGDGGRAGDPWGNGQNPNALLGKILRLDVDSAAPYAIPLENPFAKGGGAPEIFASGVRNPWRIAFDGNDIYVADVGQNKWEELSVIMAADAGANLGWNRMEGSACFRPSANCDTAGLVLPIHEYSRDGGCSITGGYVYRGSAIPELQGRYFFSDYCGGTLRALRYANGRAESVVDFGNELGSIGAVTSFGVDDAGEIYVLNAQGAIQKIVRAP
jgi:glucose/arabinose dehydrogenase